MADISISLANIQNTRIVELKGLGEITVRRLGSGEDLELSFRRRKMNKLIDELNSVDYTKFDTNKPQDVEALEKLAKRVDAISDEIIEIKKFEFDTYKALLTDNENGRIVDMVMNTLTDKERAEVFLIAFGDKPNTTEEKVNG